jgi:Acetyltransferase (GNAT) domain
VDTVRAATSADVRELPDGRRLVTARDVEAVEALRPAWDALQPQRVVADIDFFLTSLQADDQLLRPHVLLLESDGHPQAMAIARLERLTLPYRLGYRRVFTPTVRSLSVVPGGTLGELTPDAFGLLFDELRREARREEADFVLFRYIPVESQLYRWASTRSSVLTRQHVVQAGIRWEIELPSSFDEFLSAKSSRFRKAHRAQRNRLEREFGDGFRIDVITEPERLGDFLEAVEEVAARTYQHALGVGFGDSGAHRERARVASEKGWFRGYVLSLVGKPAAFAYGEVYQGVFRSGTPGFDPAYADYSIGNVLRLRMIEDLCELDGVRTLDFGLGDADFKRRLATRGLDEANVYVFSPTLRGVWLNLMHTVLIGAARGLHRAARRSGSLATIKRRWRARVAPVEPS